MPSSKLLRNSLIGLTRLAARDIDTLLRRMNDPQRAEEPLRDVLPALVDVYGAAAGTLAADWYDDTRDEKSVRRRFRAMPARIDDTGTQALVGWALSTATDMPAFESLILGGTERRILDHSRLTIMESSLADPSARGWQRETAGGCAFCELLASRGTVYSEESADFASHDNCRCTAIPSFEGEARPVQPYEPSLRDSTEADRARVREYIRTQ